jgi:hypothetical protein
MVRPARLERATSWFVARRSIQLSYGRFGLSRDAGGRRAFLATFWRVAGTTEYSTYFDGRSRPWSRGNRPGNAIGRWPVMGASPVRARTALDSARS